MEQSKGKSVTTSVPSIAIKFHANAEQIEELYGSDADDNIEEISTKSTGSANEAESSPLKYLRLVKRSTSVEINPNNSGSTTLSDASPPSDPWRFFTDIKGKITKSVEDKITEIKAKHNEEGSPLKKTKDKESKENSSVSDSEDISESSISKTCGIVSTTEGAEMSSDEDETPFSDNHKGDKEIVKKFHRFRLIKNKTPVKEGNINKNVLRKLYNTGIEQALPDDNDDDDGVENAVDALEENNLEDNLLEKIAGDFDNIKVDEDFIEIEQIVGADLLEKSASRCFAPSGFVDYRQPPVVIKKEKSNTPFIVIVIILTIFYWVIHKYSPYLAGIILGLFIGLIYNIVYNYLNTNVEVVVREKPQIIEIPAVKEYQPLTKYEGWANELPDDYNPHTYHISQTQSVYLKLQGNFLRVSLTRSKIPKRAMWNEQNIKPIFTHHRIYNLLGAKISLLPEGLTRKRLWSKKYPICVVLNEDQLNFDPFEEEGEKKKTKKKDEKKGKLNFRLRKKASYPYLAQRFSKLTEEEGEYDFDSEHSSPEISDEIPIQIQQHDDDADSCHSLPDDWTAFTTEDTSSLQTKIFIFGRTGREKEDWFRRLTAATHKGAHLPKPDSFSLASFSDTLIENASKEAEYLKYMALLTKVIPNDDSNGVETVWLNSLLGRILYDCLYDPLFTERVKDRIERKLSTIKLPYFIEHLQVNEISLGQNSPLIHKISKPQVDERGLWIDLDVTYEGLVVLILQTKLNLMKLKQQPQNDKSNCVEQPQQQKQELAMFNSDVDDSAESSTEDEGGGLNWLQNSGNNTSQSTNDPVGGTSNSSKKFIKMVDKIAESKFFQAATEYRYIKKAMEEVSNTELRLKVEFRELKGTAVLNIPPPPSDRIWIGFKATPLINVSAHPIVGARNINLARVTSWIEKKILLEFQKYIVIPNMDDFVIDVMSPKLPA